MTELPKGWSQAALAEIAEVVAGQSPAGADVNDSGEGTPFFQGKAEFGDLYPVIRKWTANPTRVTRQGDVLLSVRAPVGPTNLAPCNCAIGRGLMAVRASPRIAERYVLWATRASAEKLRAHATGSTFEAVTGPIVRRHVIPIAPRGEQERIVSAIEEALSKLDAGQAGLRTVRKLLKRMRDTILAAAVTGRLAPQDATDTPAAKVLADLGIECLQTGESPPGWARVRLDDIARVGSGSTPRRGRAEYWSSGSVPWVTSGSLSGGVVRSAAEFVTELALRETPLRLWPPGTLLVAMYGEGRTRGRCAELAIEATCNQACAAIDLRPELRGYRSLLRLHFDANYSANRRLASGGVQPNLSGTLIRGMAIALPPRAEAERIVMEVERQFSFLDACSRAVDSGLGRSSALRRSVLKAALEGKLVPQDPSDEPSSVLLEGIRAERLAASTPRTRRARTMA